MKTLGHTSIEEVFANAPAEGDFLKRFARLADIKLVRLFPELEYEIKLAIHEPGSPDDVLALVLSQLDSPHVAVSTVRVSSVMHPTYRIAGDIEYSEFEYENRPIQKIKSHERVLTDAARNIYVMKSAEDFEYHPDRMKVNSELAVPVGSLVKERCKTFIMHGPTLTVHSLAVTRCTTGNACQMQVEIEYAGHCVSRLDDVVWVGEPEILHVVSALGALFVDSCNGALVFDAETKLEFLRRALNESEGWGGMTP